MARTRAKDSDKNTALPSTPQEWMDDLSLMRHFVRETALQPLGTSDEVQFLWQENITDEALKYPLVSFTNPSRNWI